MTATPTPSPRVVGLDLSLTATGIAYRDGCTGTVRTRTADGDRRLVQIAEAVHIAIGGEQIGLGPLPDLVVIEDLPTHARAAGIVGMVHGAVRTVLLDAGVPYAVVPPASLKSYATGKGNADKTQMALATYKRAGLELADDNQVDAWWLRAAGLQHLGAPCVTVPAAQCDRLAKVDWPVVVPA
jgi:Holliday junction resolvasome RuvABC endonuclease subunit